MTTTQILIEIGKMVSPIITVGLAAFLAARYYEKNKRVDFSLKLSERAVEEVYNPIILKIEKEALQDGFSYEGLSAYDLEYIDSIFSKNRHLVAGSLFSILWRYQEDVYYELNPLYKGKDGVIYNEMDRFLDDDREFLKELNKVRDFHLKRIGFYFEDKTQPKRR